MPAKHTLRADVEGACYHVYNKGIEARKIFAGQEDYEIFLKYLSEYLSPPADPKTIKKTFKVGSRTFEGVPHQPKNYDGKIELVAFSLKPDSFHLLIHQTAKGSLASLIRSLCTRYSMFFNKKYNRAGTLFEGPYKSISVDDGRRMLLLTRFFHKNGDCSSYPEYLGKRNSSWVKPSSAVSLLDKETGSYKNFVEKYEPSREENEMLERITLESTKKAESYSRDNFFPSKDAPPTQETKQSVPWLKLRFPEFAASFALFLILILLGVRNIKATSALAAKESESPPPQVSGVGTETAEEEKKTLTIKIADGEESVNVRMEPSTRSTKTGKVNDGEIYEIVSENSGWYQIKFEDGSTGFVSSRYAKSND